MLNRIRYEQQLRQHRAATTINKSDLVTYQERDINSGLRLVQTADGGIQLANYMSNSDPNRVQTYIPSNAAGLSGFINQKSR